MRTYIYNKRILAFFLFNVAPPDKLDLLVSPEFFLDLYDACYSEGIKLNLSCVKMLFSCNDFGINIYHI